MQKEYLVVAFDGEGNIEATGYFKAQPEDAYRAGRARAVITASEKFQVFEMSRESGRTISFVPVPATRVSASKSKK